MKKIGFLTDSIFTYGGVQRVTAVIASALSNDYDVDIITFDPPKAEDRRMYNLENHAITVRYASYPPVNHLKECWCRAYSWLYKKILPQNKWTSQLYAHSSFPSERRQALERLLCKGHYDVIIGVHAFLTIRLASIKKDLIGTKVIGWIHNSFSALFCEGSPYLGPELQRFYGYQLKQLDTVIVLNNADAEEYRRAFELAPQVISNPLTMRPGPKASGDTRRMLAVGRMSPRHKGFDILIKAFSIFAQKHPDWMLDIVGEGPEQEALKCLIKEREMDKQITLHPFTNYIQKYYSKAQLYILSSRWEGFGLVLVEAMSHGVPVISSDLPSSYDILGDNGIYFKNGDEYDLAEKMEEAASMNWEKASMNALSIAQSYDIERIRKRWITIIEN